MGFVEEELHVLDKMVVIEHLLVVVFEIKFGMGRLKTTCCTTTEV